MSPDALGAPVPVDSAAEPRLCGVAITSVLGASYAVDFGVDDSHFYDPRLGRIFRVATECTTHGIDARIADIAFGARDHVSFVEQLERLSRIALVDERGHYARRVLDAAHRRARYLDLVRELREVLAA